jgi:CRP-like cAMP-binding protein
MPTINVERSVSLIGEKIQASEHAYYSERKRNQRIELKTYNSVCYLKKGSVSVYRLENNILTLTIKAPAILGLAQMRNETKSHYLRCDMDCEMWVISTPDAIELFNSRNLWMHAYDILTRHLQMYFIRENMLSQPTIRGIVMEHLKYIWSLPLAERLSISVYTFILARNQVSRSAVHKVLREFISTGEAHITRGKLSYLKE